jgi:hypothetical protein
MNILQQPTYLGKGTFNTSTFGVLPASERLAIATKALRDLAREQRKRAKHAAGAGGVGRVALPAGPLLHLRSGEQHV